MEAHLAPAGLRVVQHFVNRRGEIGLSGTGSGSRRFCNDLVAAVAVATHNPAPPGPIALTCNELARLLNRLIIDPARRLADILNWVRPEST